MDSIYPFTLSKVYLHTESANEDGVRYTLDAWDSSIPKGIDMSLMSTASFSDNNPSLHRGRARYRFPYPKQLDLITTDKQEWVYCHERSPRHPMSKLSLLKQPARIN